MLKVVLAALASAGVQPAAAQASLRDDRGVVVTLATAPQRIVSLLPSLTETVCALGGCDRLVGTDRFSDWPESVLPLPKLGGVDDAQIERILGLKPDLVLAPPSSRAVGRLQSLGLSVVVLESNSHADVRRTLVAVAQLLGGPADGASMWARIERQIAAAGARVPASVRGRSVYFEIDSSPYGAGPTSFIGETLDRLGMVNIVPAALGPFPKLNPEFVVRAQPDVVMAAQRSLADMARRPGWHTLRALRDGGGRCGFEGQRYELLVRPGPRLGEAAGVLADCLAGMAARR